MRPKRSFQYPIPGLPAENHSKSQCWNPHLHVNRPDVTEKQALARLNERTVGLFDRAVGLAPLCVFGGKMFSRYSPDHVARGLYAYCARCESAISLRYAPANQWPDMPESHCQCGRRLRRRDLYQGVHAEPSPGVAAVVGESWDPALPLLEAAAAAGGRAYHTQVVSLAAHLGNLGLLGTFQMMPVLDNVEGVESEARRRRVWNESNDWFSQPGLHFEVAPTKIGLAFLRSRNLLPSPQARAEAERFLGLPPDLQSALGQYALADRIIKKYRPA